MTHFSNSIDNNSLSQGELLAKQVIEQIKQNRERKAQGLPPLTTLSEQEQVIPEEVKQDTKPVPVSSNRNSNAYSMMLMTMNNTVAELNSDKYIEIAKLAKKDKHIIYKFDEGNKKPPKLGEKRNTKDTLVPLEVYYNELDNEINDKLEDMRSKVNDLTTIKTLSSSSIDDNGKPIPPVYPKNDIKMTGISDKVFLHINEEIRKLNKEIIALMAEWYYGIPKDLLPHLETTSFSNALQAAMYRTQFGIVNESKNSTAYLT